MSLLRSLIPFRLSHLLETSALTRILILLKNSRSPARASRSVYAHAQLSALGARAHPGGSCDLVNQVARESRLLSCSFARNGKTLRIESPQSTHGQQRLSNLACLPSPDLLF